MARVYGDEFHSYIESLDGELLSGSRDEEVLEEAAQIRRIRRAHQGAGDMSFPTKGSPHSLVLLVSFSDLDMGESLQNFKDLLNKSGYNYNGATGSCRDFYIASSDSIFLPEFDCFGPYKMPKSMEYYGGNSGNSNSQNAHEMVAEACQMAHNAGVNFKNYDANNDGILDNVFVFYAGHNEAEGGGQNTIWPHQSNIAYLSVRLDGILVNSYACTSEYKSASGKTRCGVGTFCHEFGHVIGQPDFYDTKYNYYSVGNWSIMCLGS
jgi:M6 family metalloprotease-like protein